MHKDKHKKSVFEKFDGTEVTNNMLQEAAHLFSEHYGVWSGDAAKTTGKHPGSCVRLTPEKLRDEHLPDPSSCQYVKVTVDDELAGNVFACRWVANGKTVCWVTQLVVHHDYRERGLATGLLNELRQDGDDIYGIMSCHPAAIKAAAKAFAGSMARVQFDFVKENMVAVIQASPVKYIKEAELEGILYDPSDASGQVSSANTGFYVDHRLPLEALKRVKDVEGWSLGELLEGREFAVLLRRPGVKLH